MLNESLCREATDRFLSARQCGKVSRREAKIGSAASSANLALIRVPPLHGRGSSFDADGREAHLDGGWVISTPSVMSSRLRTKSTMDANSSGRSPSLSRR